MNIELASDKPFSANHCGQCSRCMQACPAQAIVEQGVVDARRCLSYRTIEQKQTSLISTESLHGRAFGCDICQEVCPWNKKPNLLPPNWLPILEAEWPKSVSEWKAMSSNEFKIKFGKSALARTGYVRFIQNLDLL